MEEEDTLVNGEDIQKYCGRMVILLLRMCDGLLC